MIHNTLDRSTRMRIAEALAHAGTLTALVLTYLLAAYTREINPVAATLLETLGYVPTAGLALGAVSALFVGYRRLAGSYPRTAEAGAWAIVAVGVLDVGVNAWRLSVVGFPETWSFGVVAGILACGLAGALVVRGLEYWRAVVAVGAGGLTLARLYCPRPSRRDVRTGVLVLVLLALVLTPALGVVPFENTSEIDPVRNAIAGNPTSTISNDFADGNISLWQESTAATYSTSSTSYQGDKSLYLSTSQIENKDARLNSTAGAEFTFYLRGDGGGTYEPKVGWSGNNGEVELGGPNADDRLGASYPDPDGNSQAKYISHDFEYGAWYKISGTVEDGSWTVTFYNLSSGGTDLGSVSFETLPMDAYLTLNVGSNDPNTAYLDYYSVTKYSASTPTATPTPDEQFRYSLGVCYRGDAEFRWRDATATWKQIDTPQDDPYVSPGEGAVEHEETTLFQSASIGASTVTEITDRDDETTEVEIRSDRIAIDIYGLNPSPTDTFQQFAIDTPFGLDIDSPEGIPVRSALACQPEDTPSGTFTPTPFPTDTVGTGTPMPSPGTPPENGPSGDITALGVCTVPDGNETKKGLLVEYWDPSYSTESIDYRLTYKGVTGSDYVRFDEPKGYYYGCSAGEQGIDPPPGGEPTPYPTLTPYPNGTTPTPFPTQTPFPTPTDGPGDPPICEDGEAPASDEAAVELEATLSNGSTVQDTDCGFDDPIEDPFNLTNPGGGVGPIGGGGGGGSPVLGFALIAALGYGAARATGRAPSLSETASQASQAARNVVRRVR